MPDLICEAAVVLWEHRLRSMLTLLGLVIGVAAIIAIQVLGHGVAGAATGLFAKIDGHTIFVVPRPQQHGARSVRMNLRDVRAIAAEVPGVVEAMPFDVSIRLVRVGHRSGRFTVMPDGARPFFRGSMRFGRGLDQVDVERAANVAVISQRLWRRLYPDEHDPVGELLRVGTGSYRIVGVSEPLTSGILPVRGADVTIPVSVYLRAFFHHGPITTVRVTIADIGQLKTTEDAVKALLVRRHQGADAFAISDLQQLDQTIDGVLKVVTVAIGLVGGVALLVAGVNIMNIMLVSVAERTREIGIRKAIGASRRQILAHFLVEALVLSSIGCAAGLLIGAALGELVERDLVVKISGVVPVLPWGEILFSAASFAAVVTLVFGTYPAYRAACLDPVAALRHE